MHLRDDWAENIDSGIVDFYESPVGHTRTVGGSDHSNFRRINVGEGFDLSDQFADEFDVRQVGGFVGDVPGVLVSGRCHQNMVVQGVPELVDGTVSVSSSSMKKNRHGNWRRKAGGYFYGNRISVSAGLRVRSFGYADHR